MLTGLEDAIAAGCVCREYDGAKRTIEYESILTDAGVVGESEVIDRIARRANAGTRAEQAPSHAECASSTVVVIPITAFTKFIGGIDLMVQAGVTC